MIAVDVVRIATKMGEAFRSSPPLGGTLKLDFGADGAVFIEGTVQPVRVSAEEPDAPFTPSADCTVTVDLDTFKKMVTGEADTTAVYMQGKLKVTGDIALALKLGPALHDARDARGTPET